MASIRIDGIAELVKRIETAEQLKNFKAKMHAAALHIKGVIATYPPQSSRPQPFVSARQRRGFFAKLRAGQIDVPYRRGISPGS